MGNSFGCIKSCVAVFIFFRVEEKMDS